MKIMYTISLVTGIIFISIGSLSFIFDYPYNSEPNSGPANLWELILMISHDGTGWFLLTGVFLIFLFVNFKLKQTVKSNIQE